MTNNGFNKQPHRFLWWFDNRLHKYKRIHKHMGQGLCNWLDDEIRKEFL